MPQRESFESVWQKLKSLLQDLSPNLIVKVDEPGNYYLDTPYSEKWKKEVFFGAAQIKKNYVSFHLMPVYMYPDLVGGLSPDLKKRMQGKSCFNFKSIDDQTLAELKQLVHRSMERVKHEKLL